MGPAWHLFFSGDINRDLQGFPATAFPFAGGQVGLIWHFLLLLRGQFAYTGFFLGSDWLLVQVTFTGKSHNDLSIIGHCSSAEPNNVAHDLVNKQLYFHIIDSELLDG